MLFSTVAYFVFFFVVLALFYTLPAVCRKPLLLAASYFFYMSWNWKFIPLLLILTAIDYSAAIWIERTEGRGRHMALLCSLAANLGFLGFFKYYNFLAANLAALLGRSGQAFHLSIVLPLGISFHTFQSISYVVDVYRGQQRAIRKPVDYALFISFFPQLVAGPIVRAERFFADLYDWRPPALNEIRRGAYLIVLGLAKKLALADNFAAVADAYFARPVPPPGVLSAWSAVVAFALQIFFDFSGYTDIAIGSAQLLGFHFPRNFRQPYLAISITDFWRRWHISLSTWLRDYLYIPLGGNRLGKFRTYGNLMLTMLLGGLWHGANWTFVVWGGYHGVLLAIERAFRLSRIRDRPLRFRDLMGIAVTFVLVCIGWVFFRAQTVPQAMHVLGRMVQTPRGAWTIEPALLVLTAIALVLALMEDRGWIEPRVERASIWSLGVWLGIAMLVVELFAPDQSRAFIYFQF